MKNRFNAIKWMSMGLRLNHCFLLLLCCFAFTFSPAALALTLEDDPQFIVMDFATMNELPWDAPEDEWQQEVKPVVEKEIREMMDVLPKGTEGRKLAFSTLMEYMNFPMDTPSSNSPYVVKMRRILEVAEDLDLPLFVPLNGFQWWDELPELYNWWDPDGTNTAASFFARQKRKDFKERFIKGYNPDNRYNVEWQDFETPMKLNYRNWGGGGFRLAPPPNLLPHTRNKQTYRTVVEARLEAILKELMVGLQRWEKEGRLDRFAGITIGTEVSLNASVTPSDEFVPYGYRGIQDMLCQENEPTCGVTADWSQNTLHATRSAVVAEYLNDLTAMAARIGIPKQRIYTHVWGEAEAGHKRFAPYQPSAFTLFSRPGMSFYGYAKDPLSLFTWQQALKTEGYPAWGGVEYSTDKTTAAWTEALSNTLDSSISSAKIIDLYNWGEHKDTQAIPVIAKYLQQDPEPETCTLPEVIPDSPVTGSETVSWKYFNGDKDDVESATIEIAPGDIYRNRRAETKAELLSPEDITYSIKNSPSGIISWYVTIKGCNGKKRQTSQPAIMAHELKLTPESIPFWVPLVRPLFEFFNN